MTVTDQITNSTTPQMSSAPQQGVLSPKLITALADSEDAKKLVTWVRGEYRKCKTARNKQERQWYLNMAFYRGDQWVTYLKGPGSMLTSGKLSTPKAPPYRIRLTINRVRSMVRTEISRMTSNKPNASVVPASSEDEDLFAASAGEQVWESLYVEKNLARIYARTAFWQSVCGIGYIKCWWDPNAIDKATEQMGDICFGVVTPFHLFVPDLEIEEIEDQPYVINAYTKPVIWAKQTYGQDFVASTIAATEIMDEAFLDLSSSKNAKPDSVLVLEMWMKPGAHKDFPDGGYVTIVDKTIVGLYAGQFYEHQQFPFIKFEHIPTGKFYSESVVTDIIPVQREYNRTRSQIVEAKNRMAKPQLMAPRGSVDASKITSEPGIVIFYRPGLNPPQPLPMQPLPNYVLEELDRSLKDIEDLSSQHEVSKGVAPSGMAATAISYLQERDDSVMATTYQSIEAGWEKLAKQTLCHVVQFWDIQRIVKVTGVDGSFDSISLKGSDMATGTDIRVEAGSALPISKAARQAFIMDMMKMNFIPPDKGLEMMEIGGVQRIYEELAIDKRQAQRENLRMRSLDIMEIEMHMQDVAEATTDARNYSQFVQQMQQGQQQTDDLGYPVDRGSEPNSPQSPPGMPVLGPPEAPSGPGAQQPSIDPNEPPPLTDPNAPQGLPSDPNAIPQQPLGSPDPNNPQQPSGPQAPVGPQQDLPQNLANPTPQPIIPPTTLVPVNTWDNHSTHIEVHNRFRKSQAFELLQEEIKEQFEAHVEAHAVALMQAANNAQATMGGPPSNGGSGGPPSNGMPGGNNQFGPPGTSNGAPPPGPPQQ